MDFETEKRLAALLLEEARRLRLQADNEGVHAYLQQPNARHRPNSRFLTATVLGVQQANRVVEVNEMWRAREKELELESKMKKGTKDRIESRGEKRKSDSRSTSSSTEQEDRNCAASSSMSKSYHSNSYSDEDGLRDEEVEEFLHSRVKRGRGAIGSRMNEPGPYLTAPSDRHDHLPSPDTRVKEQWECRVQGPEKPLSLKSKSPDHSRNTKAAASAEEASTSERRDKKEKKKEKSSEKKKRKEKKRSKHHHHRHKSRRRE